MSAKYAVCIWGELRGVQNTIDSLYKHVIEPLCADIYICCQKTFANDEETLKLYKTNLKGVHLYDKPDPRIYLGPYYKEVCFPSVMNNWINPGNSQHYINFHKLATQFGPALVNYDYIICMRSDLYFTYPMPLFHTLGVNKNVLWNYSGHTYHGLNYILMCVPVAHIHTYLNGAYNAFQNESLIKHIHNTRGHLLNCEIFMYKICAMNNLSICPIDINSFISANSTSDRTTWADISYDSKTNHYYKYAEQYQAALHNASRWESGKRWKYINNETTTCITLA